MYMPVSYTHLDVYKRQLMNHMPNLAQAMKKSIEENAEMKKQIEDYIREKSIRFKEEIVAKRCV